MEGADQTVQAALRICCSYAITSVFLASIPILYAYLCVAYGARNQEFSSGESSTYFTEGDQWAISKKSIRFQRVQHFPGEVKLFQGWGSIAYSYRNL